MFIYIFFILSVLLINATPYVIFLTRNGYQGNFTSSGAVTICQNEAQYYEFPEITKTIPVLAISTGSCTSPQFCYGLIPPDKSKIVIGLNGIRLGNYSVFTCDGPTGAYSISAPNCKSYENNLNTENYFFIFNLYLMNFCK